VFTFNDDGELKESDAVLHNTHVPRDIEQTTDLHKQCARHLHGRYVRSVLTSGRAKYRSSCGHQVGILQHTFRVTVEEIHRHTSNHSISAYVKQPYMTISTTKVKLQNLWGEGFEGEDKLQKFVYEYYLRHSVRMSNSKTPEVIKFNTGNVLLKSVKTIQFRLKSDSNNGHFT
jgi:hypothetical protein